MEDISHSTQQVRYTVVLLGRKVRLKDVMVRRIVENQEDFHRVSSDCVVAESSTFQVISAPDVFDENNKYVDQHVIDVMALSQPGPHIFILAIDLENADETKIEEQIKTLKGFFGEVSPNLVVTLPDIESYQSFSHLKYKLSISLAIANENLASLCKDWCVGRKRFTYNYQDYSKAVVMRRRDVLSKLRSDDSPVPDCAEAADSEEAAAAVVPQSRPVSYCDTAAAAVVPLQSPKAPHPPSPGRSPLPHGNSPDTAQFFNIILLGLTGTGKSASANTILKATKSKQRFKSTCNSEPVTKECQSETTELYGTRLTVVDTPDFFHESLENNQDQVEQCKKYLVPGHYVVLLVLKLNRFTDQERDILQKLEDLLDKRIRDNTILLLTCGEDLKGILSDFINRNTELKNIAGQCCYRSHAFKNKKKNSEKQVRKLIKKLPNIGIVFPKIDDKPQFLLKEMTKRKLSLK